MTRQKAVLWISVLATLALAAGLIAGHEQVLRQGEPILLRLAPVDPRSLMQGDYMALDYEVIREIQVRLNTWQGTEPDRVILRRGPQGVYHAQRLAVPGEALHLAADERSFPLHWAKGRWSDRTPQLPSHSWFFQEGMGQRFARAEYAEYRLVDGRALLWGLRDAQFRVLGHQ